MELTGRTILITGGGTGIGHALAEQLHARGNTVIVAGRRAEALDEVAAANPGIATVVMDITDPVSIAAAAADVLTRFPALDVLINNAGIMLPDDASRAVAEDVLTRQVDTNLLGTIRVTNAFIGHLKSQAQAAIIYNSSTLAFTPLSMFASYSATKAALHAFALAQRFMLRDTDVDVYELVPPWVATGLVGEPGDERAMPVDAFVRETLAILQDGPEEIVVEAARVNRDNPGPSEHAFVNALNEALTKELAATL